MKRPCEDECQVAYDLMMDVSAYYAVSGEPEMCIEYQKVAAAIGWAGGLGGPVLGPLMAKAFREMMAEVAWTMANLPEERRRQMTAYCLKAKAEARRAVSEGN